MTTKITSDLVEDVAMYWLVDKKPTMAGFAKKHGITTRTLRRWRYRGWMDLAGYKESIFRTFAEELSKAQDARKMADAEKRKIRDQNKRSASPRKAVEGTGRDSWGEIVQDGIRRPLQKLWGVLPLSRLRKEHFQDAYWFEPEKPERREVPEEWAVRDRQGRNVVVVDVRELEDDPNRFLRGGPEDDSHRYQRAKDDPDDFTPVV